MQAYHENEMQERIYMYQRKGIIRQAEMRKKTIITFFLMAFIVALFCGFSQPVFAAAKINKTTAYLAKGHSTKLRITGTKTKPKWSSNKKTVASVTSKGVVSAKAKGTAIITAKVGKKTFKCKVIVQIPKLSPKSTTIIAGNKRQLKVTGTTQSVKWKSLNTKVATVSSKGIVTGKKQGTTTVKASVLGEVFSCRVVVKSAVTPAPTPTPTPIPEEIFYVSPVPIEMTDRYLLPVTCYEDDPLQYEIEDQSIISCDWGAWSNKSIPLVITGKKTGVTRLIISNTRTGKQISVRISVDLDVKSIKLNNNSIVMEANEKFYLYNTEVKVLPEYAYDKTYTCTSDDPSVVRVCRDSTFNLYYLEAVKAGNATITVRANAGDAIAEMSVRVEEPIIIDLPRTPLDYRTYTINGETAEEYEISKIYYQYYKKSDGKYDLFIYFNGIKTYDSKSTTNRRSSMINYKLYRGSTVVNTGSVSLSAAGLRVGNSFEQKYGLVSGISSGAYVLVLEKSTTLT